MMRCFIKGFAVFGSFIHMYVLYLEKSVWWLWSDFTSCAAANPTAVRTNANAHILRIRTIPPLRREKVQSPFHLDAGNVKNSCDSKCKEGRVLRIPGGRVDFAAECPSCRRKSEQSSG